MRVVLNNRYTLAASVGGVLGCVTMFVYLNVDPLERMTAAADGFPRWSPWQLLFTAPEGALGAAAGVVIALLTRRMARRLPTG